MQQMIVCQTNLELKKLMVEASQALAHLDAGRLEDLALSCSALNRGLADLSPEERRALTCQAKESTAEMAIFARVLEATRSNLKVMQRLQELRAGRLEYREPLSAPSLEAVRMEREHGND